MDYYKILHHVVMENTRMNILKLIVSLTALSLFGACGGSDEGGSNDQTNIPGISINGNFQAVTSNN